MSTSQSDAMSGVPAEAVREALNKVLASDALQGSERSRTLLRFVVERTLSGQTDGLKEYTLGTEALRKSSTFDPRTDSVVRSEFSRLRARLDRYYATQGQNDDLVIALSKGSYVPRFERQAIPADSAATGIAAPRRSAFRRHGPLALLAGALVAAVALISYRELVPLAPSSKAKQERVAAATEQMPVSIAVLPFVNLSGDPGQDFFADGVTEELTTVLANIPNVLVVGRTSASQFKGERRDLRAIGQALNVTHLIEGSVRKEGDRVRITAQLVRSDSGVHVWSENYDRQLTGMLALQEDVATAIAAALKLPLRLGSNQTFASLRPNDAETYELFLRGRAAFRGRQGEQAVNLLEQVVARDPDFAPGWRFLASARNTDNIQRSLKGLEPRTYTESQEALARRVIALAPNSADGYAMLATLAADEGQKLEALQFREQALQRDANDPELMNAYANDLWELGYLTEALVVRERQHVLEPLVPIYNFLRAETLAADGKVEQALRDWLAVAPKSSAGIPAGRRLILPAYAWLGRFDDAMEHLSNNGGQSGFDGALTQTQIDVAVQVLRAAANKRAPPAQLPDFCRSELRWVYAYTSTPERMLDCAENEVKAGHGVSRTIWWPMTSGLRKTERFKTLMRDAGFVDVWRARGWPDLCRPIGADEFVCD
jgi:TolB-like protein